ncbi:MAG: FAD-dependent oxidoreductase [Jhaorihella sp.]
MKRIFPPYAYGHGPRDGCWWDETAAAPDWPVPADDMTADVAIVGAGFTGLSAALHLAEAGVSVVVFEAESPGWGASGRNGGFCCLGGAALSETAMARRFGAQEAAAYSRAEVEAVNLVADLLQRLGINADTHSRGETRLAHNRRAMERLRREAASEEGAELTEAADLAAKGLGGGFLGALTTPVGFALNPRKYLFGLAEAAQAAGARLFQQSPVRSIARQTGHFTLAAGEAQLRAGTVLIATNGYSSEDVPGWLAGRYMPAQSTVLVTRPLSDHELAAQGWTSDQMAYDTRNLLHYFRLMPDRRFLFGMRGGLTSSAQAERRIRQRVQRDFRAMFPAWGAVSVTHSWSGMVCLSRALVPHVGPVPGEPGMFAALAYHGNGVAMGSFAGRLLADLALGRRPEPSWPAPMRAPLPRFPLGRARRALMPPAYAALAMGDL